jgi:hypothetical protein
MAQKQNLLPEKIPWALMYHEKLKKCKKYSSERQ